MKNWPWEVDKSTKGLWRSELVHPIASSSGGEGRYWCASQPLRWVPVPEARGPSFRELSSPGTPAARGPPRVRSREQGRATQQGADLGQEGFSPPLPKDTGNTTLACWQQPRSRCRRAPSSQARLRSLLWQKRPQAGMGSAASLTTRCGGTHRELQGHSSASAYTERRVK